MPPITVANFSNAPRFLVFNSEDYSCIYVCKCVHLCAGMCDHKVFYIDPQIKLFTNFWTEYGGQGVEPPVRKYLSLAPIVGGIRLGQVSLKQFYTLKYSQTHYN